jgi:hypothetical protein
MDAKHPHGADQATATQIEEAKHAPEVAGAPGASSAALGGALGPAQALVVPMEPGAMLDQLEREARKGRLAGFERLSGEFGFEVEAFAVPFTGVMRARVEREGERTVLRFETRMSRTMPLVWLVILVVTIWPGLPLTENLIEAVGPEGWWQYTIWWYLPLSVISLPLAIWSGLKRSRAMMHASAHTARGDIARALGVSEPARQGESAATNVG